MWLMLPCLVAIYSTLVCNPSCFADVLSSTDPAAPGPASRLTADGHQAMDSEHAGDGTYAELEPEELQRMEKDQIYLKDSHRTTVVFKQAKMIAGPIGYGHLIWEIDLSGNNEVYNLTATVLKNVTRDLLNEWYRSSTFTSHAEGDMWGRVLSANGTLEETHRNWNELVEVFSPPRYALEYNAVKQQNENSVAGPKIKQRLHKRAFGIVLAVVTTIMGAVGGFFSASQLADLSTSDEQDSSFIVKEQAILGESVHNLHQHLLEFQERLRMTEDLSFMRRSKGMVREYDNYFAQQTSLYRQDRDRQSKGLEALLRKQLSPSLVKPAQMRSAISQLKLQAEKNGYSLPSDTELYLYQLEAGFVLVRPNVIHVSLHVPMYKRSEVLQLYEAISMPLILPHSRHNLDIQLESRMIAVRGRGQGYKLLEPWQLTACSQMAGVLFCPGEDHMLKDFGMHCISALYHEPLKVSRVCRAALIPPQVRVVQLEARTFQVFHPTHMTLHQACPGQTLPDVSFVGTRLVALQPSCWAYTDKYELTAPQDISLNFSTKTAETIWGGEKLLRGLTPSQVNVVVPATLYSPVPIDDIVTKFNNMKSEQTTSKWLEILGVACACIGATLLLIALLSFCMREAIRRALHNFMIKHPHVSQLVQLLPGYLQPKTPTPRRMFGRKMVQQKNIEHLEVNLNRAMVPVRDDLRRRLTDTDLTQLTERQRHAHATAFYGPVSFPDPEEIQLTRRQTNRSPPPFVAPRRQPMTQRPYVSMAEEARRQEDAGLTSFFNPPLTEPELDHLAMAGPHGTLTRTVEAELLDLRQRQTPWKIVATAQTRRQKKSAAASPAAEAAGDAAAAAADPSAPEQE